MRSGLPPRLVSVFLKTILIEFCLQGFAFAKDSDTRIDKFILYPNDVYFLLRAPSVSEQEARLKKMPNILNGFLIPFKWSGYKLLRQKDMDKIKRIGLKRAIKRDDAGKIIYMSFDSRNLWITSISIKPCPNKRLKLDSIVNLESCPIELSVVAQPFSHTEKLLSFDRSNTISPINTTRSDPNHYASPVPDTFVTAEDVSLHFVYKIPESEFRDLATRLLIIKQELKVSTDNLGISVHPATSLPKERLKLIEHLKKLLKKYARNPEKLEFMITTGGNRWEAEKYYDIPLLWTFGVVDLSWQGKEMNAQIDPVLDHPDKFQSINEFHKLETGIGPWSKDFLMLQNDRYYEALHWKKSANLDNPLKVVSNKASCIHCHSATRSRKREYIDERNKWYGQEFAERLCKHLPESKKQQAQGVLEEYQAIVENLWVVRAHDLRSLGSYLDLVRQQRPESKNELKFQFLVEYHKLLKQAYQKTQDELIRPNWDFYDQEVYSIFQSEFKWPNKWIELSKVREARAQTMDYNFHMFSYFVRYPSIASRVGYASTLSAFILSKPL